MPQWQAPRGPGRRDISLPHSSSNRHLASDASNRPSSSSGTLAPEQQQRQHHHRPYKHPGHGQGRSNNHIFNIPKRGHARPEHHKSSQSRGSANYGIGMPIQVPTQHKIYDIPAAPKPMYSSRNVVHGQPAIVDRAEVNASNAVVTAYRNNQEVIDLTRDDKGSSASPIPVHDDCDGFNPDMALAERRFGAPDANMMTSSEQATRDMKALLAGGFEDNDDKPKLKLKNRKSKSKAPPAEEQVPSENEASNPAGHTADDEEDEVEDGSVEGLAVKLLPHQVDGVAWMLDRENGKRKKNGILPKGGILADDMGLGKTIQTIALLLLNPRPKKQSPSKTKDGSTDPERTTKKRSKSSKETIPDSFVHSTLIVAPLALIKQWESEIQTKIDGDSKMTVLVHHGPGRTKSADELKRYDVVITTYQILASEHAASGDLTKGTNIGCMGVQWYRVVLDEAHSIKNRSAKCSQASYALQSWYRWCLTGTPMQNNLDELQSLIRFLRIRPYSDYPHWKDQIMSPMKNGYAGLAIRRLQYFLKAIMKRRTKDVLRKEGALSFGGKAKVRKDGSTEEPAFKIQPRTIEIVAAEFNEWERKFYDKLAERTQTSLDAMMVGAKHDYIGALVLLLRLRQACNHPDLVAKRLGADKDSIGTNSTEKKERERGKTGSSQDVDDIADLLGGLSVTKHKCEICQVELSSDRTADGHVHCLDCASDLVEGLRDARRTGDKDKPRHSGASKKKREDLAARSAAPARKPPGRASRLVIGSDDEDEEGVGQWLKEDDSDTDSNDEDEADPSRVGFYRDQTGRSRTVANSGSEAGTDDGDDDDDDDGDDTGDLLPVVSTKIRHLLAILKKELSQDNKTIVFSEFTSMLDLIEPFLRKRGYQFVRYDGGMRNDAREASLHALRTDPGTKVLLCSLKCGGLGLNLTVACRVVLLEPFWNPVCNWKFP